MDELERLQLERLQQERLQQENAKLRAGIQAAVDGIWSWIYSRKSRRILDIHDNLKALLKGGCNG